MKVGFWKRAGRSWVGSLLASGAAAVMAAGATPGVGAGRADAAEPEGIMVAFRDQAPESARRDVLTRHGLELSRSGRRFARLQLGLLARRRGANLRSTLARLRHEPAVRVAEPDRKVHATFIPNDPFFPNLWGMHNTGQSGGAPDADIDAPEAWNQTLGSTQVIVAVIDTGVLTSHPDLTDNILRDGQGKVVGYDFVENNVEPDDDNGHGTHVAGTIGARGNNALGVTGVCPQVKIMPVKFLNANGNGNTSDAIEAIDFAVANGAHILNNSWGGAGDSQLLSEAVLRARNAGALFVAAAGNDFSNNDDLPTFPANYNQVYDNVLSVAASTAGDDVALFSNYGRQTVDLAAPGTDILSTSNTGNYEVMEGTSMATPHVSGAAALIKARYPTLNYLQMKTRLLANSDHPPALAEKTAAGRLNVNGALVADTTAPGAPGSFGATLGSSDALLLTWNASGDDGAAGRAYAYDLRYSLSPISEANFGAAARGTGLPLPANSGAAQSYLLAGLNPSTSYYLALRAIDRVGATSALVTAGPVVTGPLATPLVALSDTVEGTPLFAGQAPWSVTTEAAFSPTHSYADSAGTTYAPDTNAALIQGNPVTLAGFAPKLEFRLRHSLEAGWDFLYVEISSDLGQSWTRLPVSYTGLLTTWTAKSISLSAYYGHTVQVRFRIVTDNIQQDDGVWLDDIRISGSPLQSLSSPPPAPDPPSGVTATGVPGGISLAWQGSPGATSYILRRGAVPGGPHPMYKSGLTNPAYLDTAVTVGTAFYYTVSAVNAGGESAPSSEVSAAAQPIPPGPPSNVTAKRKTAKKSQLKWTQSVGPNVSKNRIYRSISPSGPWSVIAEIPAATKYTDNTLVKGTAYYFQVTAVDAVGVESNRSNAAFAKAK